MVVCTSLMFLCDFKAISARFWFLVAFWWLFCVCNTCVCMYVLKVGNLFTRVRVIVLSLLRACVIFGFLFRVHA